MPRRHDTSGRYGKIVWLCLCLAPSLTAPAAADGEAKHGARPNIVFIQTDSWDGRVLGCMGHPAMRRATPHVDALAQRGVLFCNAYANSPVCCPSRASMWSGKYVHHCKAWNNYKGLSPADRTYRQDLEEAGYRVQTFGKLDYLSGAHTVRNRVGAWTRSANIERPLLRPGPPQIVPDEAPRPHQQDHQLVGQTVRWLRQQAAADTRPFFLYLGLALPHPAFRTTQRYLERIDDAGVTVPPADKQDHPVMRYQRITKNWEPGFSEETVREVRRVYYAMCAETDELVGQVLAEIQRQDLAGSTYVIFTSDHGENAMEHRQWYKMNHYESSARVPLMIAGPGLVRGVTVDRPVSLVDVYPTLMEMAGCAAVDGLDGHSLMPECRGQPSGGPDWVFSEFHGITCNTGSFMVRRGPWKYIAYVGYPPQLFHLQDDPDEIRNLAEARPEVRSEMDRLLRSVVDYTAVDAQVKEYDRRSFRKWQAQMKAKGTYEKTMAPIYSGWDGLQPDQIQPWTDRDEALIRRWLGE